MGEIEAQFCRCNKGAFLIYVITEYFTEAEVKDVSCGVVVAQWPAAEL